MNWLLNWLERRLAKKKQDIIKLKWEKARLESSLRNAKEQQQ